MEIVDKRGVLASGAWPAYVELELGCGSHKRREHALGVDIRDDDAVDLVGDAVSVLAALPAASIDAVYSWHFMEHVENLTELLEQLERVLKPSGHMEMTVPHFSSPYYYSDPTHHTPFGLYTLSYLLAEHPFRRQVPHYDEPLRLRCTQAHLRFRSERPFYGRHAAKQVLDRIVNATPWGQEFYEENLTWIFPCYEVTFVVERMP